MSDFERGDFLSPRQTELLLEIYQAACQVAADFPERHIASIAARKIIAAFYDEVLDATEICRRTAPAMMSMV